MKILFFIPAVLLLFSFIAIQDELGSKNYKIYSSKTLKEVNLSDLVAEMKNYDVVFFGEEHNDSVAHYLQAELLKAMYTAYGNQTTLSMEMFETDCQIVLDEYLQGTIREKNFVKEARAWGNYKNYRPMIEFAKENKIPVAAGNAPSRYVNLAARKGRNALNDLSLTAKSFLPPLPYDTASGDYYKKFMDLMSDERNIGARGNDSTKKANPMPANMGPKYIVHSQSLWDASMAYSISKIFQKNPNAKVLQLNGRFHSDEGLGTVIQLKKYNPNLRILILSCVSNDSNFPNAIKAEENKKLGDYVIYSDPAVPKTFKE